MIMDKKIIIAVVVVVVLVAAWWLLGDNSPLVDNNPYAF
jgi:hypothetical protein